MYLYTIIGAFPALRNKMNKEFKRLGFNGIKEKRWFFNKVLGHARPIKEFTISELELVINELNKYQLINEIE